MSWGSWTTARIERLDTLWREGMSCALIASELNTIDAHAGRISRNAVIGRAYRTGLSDAHPRARTSGTPRPRQARPPKPERPRTTMAALRRSRLFVDAPALTPCAPIEPEIEDGDIPTERRRTLTQLGNDTCRWPCGDPRRDGFFFCGARPVGELPYCAGHALRAYVPASARRRERARAWR